MRVFLFILGGISALGGISSPAEDGGEVERLECYHCTYRENSDGTTFGNPDCMDVSDPEKSKKFKISIPNRFYNVTQPTPVVYRYDCMTYWRTGERIENHFTSNGAEQKVTTFTELKRDFLMIPDYNALFDYGVAGARQGSLTVLIDHNFCGSQQMQNCSDPKSYPNYTFSSFPLNDVSDTGKCYHCEGTEYVNKNTNTWIHPNAHEVGCASLSENQPVRPCDATCEVLMMSVIKRDDSPPSGYTIRPVGRFVQRGCLPTQMDAQTTAFETDTKTKNNMETCYDSLCNTGCTKDGCSSATTAFVSFILLLSSLFLF